MQLFALLSFPSRACVHTTWLKVLRGTEAVSSLCDESRHIENEREAAVVAAVVALLAKREKERRGEERDVVKFARLFSRNHLLSRGDSRGREATEMRGKGTHARKHRRIFLSVSAVSLSLSLSCKEEAGGELLMGSRRDV